MPTITIEVPDAIELEVRKTAFKVEPGKFCAAGHLKVYMYGLGRFPNDRAGAAGKREEYDSDEAFRDACLAHAHKAVDALITGQMRADRVAKPKDTAGQIAMEMAMDVLRGVHGSKIAKMDKAKVTNWCKEYLGRNPKVVAEAQLVADRRAELAVSAESDIDLDALMPDADDSEA